jgi:aminopeptidase N
VQHYDLALALFPPTPRISARATITLRLKEDSKTVELDFSSSLLVSKVHINGSRAKFLQKKDRLVLKLPKRTPEGSELSLEIHYAGTLPQRSVTMGEPVGLLTDGIGLVAYPEPDGARNWFPCNDHPSDKAKVSIDLLLPSGNFGAATGQFTHYSNSPGWTRSRWESTTQVATYLVSLAAGPFDVIFRPAPIPIIDLALPGDGERVRKNLAVMTKQIPAFEIALGPYPFSRYGHVFTRLMVGGLECQTMTVLGRMAGLGGNEGLLAHELGHQWFGDWVSPRQWKDLWLNEGGATWSEHLWARQSDNPKEAKYLLQQWRRSVLRLARSKTARPLSNPPIDNMFGHHLVYNKGGMVLYLLESWMGEETFFAALRHYFDTCGDETADTGKFQTALEESSGIDLNHFFRMWIHGTQVPNIEASFKSKRKSKIWSVSLNLTQNKKHWFPFATEVRFRSKDGAEARFPLRINSAKAVFSFELPFSPKEMALDPDALLPIRT